MNPENDARHETIEFRDIGGVKEGDEVSVIEFKCGCGHLFRTIPIKGNGTIDGMLTAQICDKQCPRCGKYSGFKLGVDKGTDTPDKLKQLCAVLNGNLRWPAEETRRIIRVLLTGRNLTLRFGVKRSDQ